MKSQRMRNNKVPHSLTLEVREPLFSYVARIHSHALAHTLRLDFLRCVMHIEVLGLFRPFLTHRHEWTGQIRSFTNLEVGKSLFPYMHKPHTCSFSFDRTFIFGVCLLAVPWYHFGSGMQHLSNLNLHGTVQ